MQHQARFITTALALLAAATMAAESADDLKPPTGYRTWFHVNTMVVDKASPLFEGLGGMHNVYANARAAAALKKGGPYPNGSQFATDLHDFTITDGSYVEGARKGVATMVKDSKKYASTGGWGFQFWAEGDAKKPQVTDPTKQCFECHTPKKDQDYVYSTYIP
jgi:Cytochrome P460